MEKAPRWRSGSLGATLLVLAVVTAVLVLAWRLPIRGGRCAGTLQFIGATAGDQYGRELLARDCGGVDVRRMLLLDYVFLIVYGVVLALICRIGAGRLYRGRMRTVAIWAGRGALAAAGADALENLMLLLVPDAVRTGERAGDTVALQLAQAFALIKWAALFPAVLISLLVVLTVAARAIAAIRPQPRVPPVLTGPGPRSGDHAAWAHNYWLPASHEAKKGGIGISLSGGGIRSGTFALGALQVFAETGLLARAKFISTVSGGGYTGGAHQLLRARGGRKLPPPPDGPGLELPEVTVKEAFAAGSPEEAHIRRHGKYIADGAAQWVRAVLTVLRNVLVNLALLYGVLFVLARPLGAAYAAAAPWTRQLFFVGETPACRPPGRPPVTSFPCVWAWPNFSLGTWLAVGLPMALALVFWVANGWPAGARSNRPGRLRRVFLDLAGGLAVLGIVVALLVVALPVLVRVFQWLAARRHDHLEHGLRQEVVGCHQAIVGPKQAGDRLWLRHSSHHLIRGGCCAGGAGSCCSGQPPRHGRP
jgi:hypothetical protein